VGMYVVVFLAQMLGRKSEGGIPGVLFATSL
jgi:hypothetical protein